MGVSDLQPCAFATLANSKNPPLVIDTRPNSLFERSRVQTALHISVPTALLKRPSWKAEKISQVLLDPRDRALFDNRNSYSMIVIYGEPTSDSARLLASKLVEMPNTEVAVLHGGFSALENDFSALIDSSSRSSAAVCSRSGLALKLSPTANAVASSSPHTVGVSKTSHCHTSKSFTATTSMLSRSLSSSTPIGLESMLISQTHEAEEVNLLPPYLSEIVVGDYLRKLRLKYKTLEEAEHQKFLQRGSSTEGLSTPFSLSIGLENNLKNRYHDILPFNYNRVKLGSNHDYINASSIEALGRRFIATQAPLASTTDDFWRMAWEQQCRIIVMLCDDNPMRPTSHSVIDYLFIQPSAGFSVCVVKSARLDSIDVRVIDVTYQGEIRTLTHIQFIGWGDRGVPRDAASFNRLHSIVEYARDYWFNHSVDENAPIIVHCSAGCGRTGTFIALSTVLSILGACNSSLPSSSSSEWPVPLDINYFPPSNNQRASSPCITASESSSDSDSNNASFPLFSSSSSSDIMMQVVLNLRAQRMFMVQSFSQFVFCYEALLVYFLNRQKGPCNVAASQVEDQLADLFHRPQI